MFKNYLKISLRTLWKNKKFTAINVFGLATGMACSLLIFLFVQDELRYDRYHADSELIHRVVKDFVNDDGSRIPDATTPAPLAAAMQRELPEVTSVTRIHPAWGGVTRVKYDDKEFSEPKMWRVDSSFFRVFTVPFLKGNPQTALSDVNSIIFTETAAKRYFGDEDPIGKTLTLIGQGDVTVTAVIRDVPDQSHIHYDFLLSFRRLPRAIETNWGGYNYYTYVKVKPGTDIKTFDEKIQGVYERNQAERYSDFYTQPLTDIHLTSKLKWELEPNGDQMYVYVFMAIGIFILLIACINYINLSTAKSSLRAKETGVRKVSGAERSSLIFQFLLESVIICVLASFVATALAYMLTPTINNLTLKQLDLINNPIVFLYLFMTSVLTGILAGIFPALYLSSFKPVSVLKGLKLTEHGTLSLRKTLVVIQFTISSVLIISVLIISQQMNYVRSADLGFNKEQVVVVKNASYLSSSERTSFLNDMRNLSGIVNVATSGGVLGQGFSTTRLRARGSEQVQQLNFASIGEKYLEVIGIEIIEGRSFSNDFPADTLSNGTHGLLNQSIGGIIINERAVKEFGISAPVVGKELEWDNDGDTSYYVKVIGVAKDFHFTSLRNEIKPFGFIWRPIAQGNFTAKLAPETIITTMEQLGKTWEKNFPDVPFEYTFMDQTFDRMYAAETRFQKIFIILVILGVIIACLGLFALAAFAAEQRVKEIGIRKVLGASVSHVVQLLSKDFLKLVVIALILAIPLSAWLMENWLKGFAYRVSLQWWIFAIAALIALFIALSTIIAQAVKAARTNPAKSLRSE